MFKALRNQEKRNLSVEELLHNGKEAINFNPNDVGDVALLSSAALWSIACNLAAIAQIMHSERNAIAEDNAIAEKEEGLRGNKDTVTGLSPRMVEMAFFVKTNDPEAWERIEKCENQPNSHLPETLTSAYKRIVKGAKEAEIPIYPVEKSSEDAS